MKARQLIIALMVVLSFGLTSCYVSHPRHHGDREVHHDDQLDHHDHGDDSRR